MVKDGVRQHMVHRLVLVHALLGRKLLSCLPLPNGSTSFLISSEKWEEISV